VGYAEIGIYHIFTEVFFPMDLIRILCETTVPEGNSIAGYGKYHSRMEFFSTRILKKIKDLFTRRGSSGA